MAENGRKSCRKRKLVPREFEEYDESEICYPESHVQKTAAHIPDTTASQNVYRSHHSLLPDVKDQINGLPIYEPVVAGTSFSVQVEVEQFEETLDRDEYYDDDGHQQKKRLNYDLESTFAVLSDNELRCETEKLMETTTSPADKLLEVEIRNFWGKYPAPVEPSYHEVQIQSSICEWRLWHLQSKNRFAIQCYKCYICKIGFWHLGPFRTHINLHEDVKVCMDTFQHDCCLIAYNETFPVEEIQFVKIEGKCWQCLKSYEQHNIAKINANFYACVACGMKMPTCRSLFEHEGVCQRYHKIVFQNEIATESSFHCQFCNIKCLTSKRYDEHMLSSHLVRSDMPILFTSVQKCSECHMTFLYTNLHQCAMKKDTQKCIYCFRWFTSRALFNMHQRYTNKESYCNICHKYLRTQCSEVQHMIRHSKNYVLVYKCKQCIGYVLFATESGIREHKFEHHHKDRKQRIYEEVVVPISCMTKKWARELIKPGDAWEDKQPNAPYVYRSILSSVLTEPNETPAEPKPSKSAKTKASSKQKLENKEAIPSIVNKDIIPDEQIKVETSELEKQLLNSPTPPTVDAYIGDEYIGPRYLGGALRKTSEEAKTSKSDEYIGPRYLGGALSKTNEEPKTRKTTKNPRSLLLHNIEAQNEYDTKEGILDIAIHDGNVLGECIIKDSDSSQDTISIKQEFADTSQSQDVQDTDKQKDNDDDNSDIQKETDEINERISLVQFVNEHAYSQNARIKQEIVEENNHEADLSDDDILEIKEIPRNLSDVVIEIDSCDEEEERNESSITIKQETNKDETVKDTIPSDTLPNLQIKTEVSIKEEVEHNNEYEDVIEDDEIKEEHEACLAEFSKVFKASKSKAGSVELSGICLNEEYVIKEESDDEMYEDDIIMLDDTNETNSVSETSLNISETVEKDDDFIWDSDMGVAPAEIDSDSEEIYRGGKMRRIYQCSRCSFQAEHKAYKHHVANVCPRKRHDKTHIKHSEPKTHQAIWKRYCCTKCGDTYPNLMLYLGHFHKHGLRIGTCPECCEHFATSSEGTRHLLSHIKMSFMKLQLLKDAECISSKSSGLYQCKICPEKVKFDKFFEHWERHLTLKKKKIKKETPSFSLENVVRETIEKELTSEQKLMTPEKLKLVLEELQGICVMKSCSVCKKEFGRKNDIKRHLIEHLLANASAQLLATNMKFQCQVCREELPKPDQYRIHMRNHASLPIFKCETCDKCFSDSSNFAKHKKTHKNIRVLVCDICRKKFHSRIGIERHMEIHKNNYSAACDLCDRVFYSDSDLKKHKKSRHDKHSHKFSCFICKTKFVALRELWDHKWIQHGQRKIEANCPICGEKYRKMHDVNTHLRLAHDFKSLYYSRKWRTMEEKYQQVKIEWLE